MAEQLSIDPLQFRQVLGQYPTGVCAVCAMEPDGTPVGMVVGSFTSVSLDPPIVAFLPDRKSSTWAKLSQSPRFCVNILAADQEWLCRKLSSKDPDKFSGIAFELSPLGTPIIKGVVGWIDCEVRSIEEAGDHFLVLGNVRQLEVANGGLPLIFFQGGYGRFTPSSILAVNVNELLAEHLRIIEIARPEMDSIVADVAGQCVAQARLGDEIVVIASAGQPADDTPPVLMGQRAPFAAPFGMMFAASLPEQERENWIVSRTDPARQDYCRDALNIVRKKGYTVTFFSEFMRKINVKLGEIASADVPAEPAEFNDFISDQDYKPHRSQIGGEDISVIFAPIFDTNGSVALSLALRGLSLRANDDDFPRYVTRLREGARRITKKIGGHEPQPDSNTTDAA